MISEVVAIFMWLPRLAIQLSDGVDLDEFGHGEVPQPEISRYVFRYRQISPDIARYRAICRPDCFSNILNKLF